MRFICKCTGDEDIGDYNFAVVELSTGVLDWLSTQLAIAKILHATNPNFYCLEYFDYQADYYRDAPPDYTPEDGEFLPMGAHVEWPEEELRTSAPTVCITADSVIWKGHPKHGSGQFETATLTEETLEAFNAQLGGKPEEKPNAN